jgi:hypothetical protein
MPHIVTEEIMLETGLEILGFWPTNSPTLARRRFRDLYGGNPKSAAQIYNELQTVDIGNAKIEKINLRYYLMTRYFARGYEVENRVMSKFGIKCNKTFEKHIAAYFIAVQALKAKKVSA